MNKVVISVTGHRKLTAEQKTKVEPVLTQAIKNIMFVSSEQGKATHFSALTPIAEGADTMFAHAARSLSIPLHIMLPYERSTYLKGFSSDQARSDFDTIYNDEAVAMRTTLSPLQAHEVEKLSGERVNELYMDIGRKIVDDADYIIAIWDEKIAKGVGGTGDVVAYAVEKKKNVLIINPEDEHPDINYINPDSHADKTRLAVDPHETNHLAAYLNNKQRVYDTNAGKHNKIYRRTWTIAFVAGLIELMAFAIIISFGLVHPSHVSAHYFWATFEFLCICLIIGMLFFGNAKKHHSYYIHFRIVAERLRIKNYFSKLGFHIYEVPVSPIYASLKAKPEYRILDHTIKLINISAYSYLSFDKKKHYLETELIQDQHKYHERKKEKFEKKAKLYNQVRIGLLLLFVCAVLTHYVNISFEFYTHHPLVHNMLFEECIIFISLFIPATVAACEALKYLYEWEKIIVLSESMADYFKEKSHELKHTNTEKELEIFLNEINKDMLIENLDWEKYMHDKHEMPT